MKQLLFIVAIFFISNYSLNASIIDSIQYRNDKVVIEDVILVPNATASQLYGKAKVFFSTISTPKLVVESEDLENHQFVGKGKIVKTPDEGYGCIFLNFTLILQVKDGKYRYIITDMMKEITGLAPMLITAEKSAQTAKEKNNPAAIKDYYIDTRPLIELLKKQMKIDSGDDW